MRQLLGTCTLTLLVLTVLPPVSARQSGVVSFTIDDSYPGQSGPGVFSDAGETGASSYHDYRVDPQEYLNWCVDGEPAPPGNLFVRLNRKLDGAAGVLRCTENPRPDGELGTQRNFVLRIADREACGIASDPAAGLPVVDANGAPWAPGAPLPCTIQRNDNPRIRLGALYKSRAKVTNVDFLLVMFGYPNSYEIRSDIDAPIKINPLSPNLRTITYDGTFRLVKFEPGQKARAVGRSFTMPLRMEFIQH